MVKGARDPLQRHEKEDAMQPSTLVLVVMAAAAPAHTQEKPMPVSTDEQSILELHEQFAAAWSRGDADALSRFSPDDALRVGASGDVAHGPSEMRAAYAKLFSGPFQGASVKIASGTVRFLSADIALWEAPIEIALPSRSIAGFVVDVMAKRGGSWVILETHPKLYPVKPDEPAKH